MARRQEIYCRYHQVSPFCVAKHRPLRENEMTLEHLIPKSRLRTPSFRSKFGLRGIGASSPQNTDISCYRCNHYKKNATDLEFVWKLQYCEKYGIPLQSKQRIAEALSLDVLLPFAHRLKVVHTVLFGECQIQGEHAYLSLGKYEVTLYKGKLAQVIHHRKLLFDAMQSA